MILKTIVITIYIFILVIIGVNCLFATVNYWMKKMDEKAEIKKKKRDEKYRMWHHD